MLAKQKKERLKSAQFDILFSVEVSGFDQETP